MAGKNDYFLQGLAARMYRQNEGVEGQTFQVPPPPPADDRQDDVQFLRLSDAANVAQVTEPTLRSWEERGLPVYRPSPGVALVDRRELVEFIKTGKVARRDDGASVPQPAAVDPPHEVMTPPEAAAFVQVPTVRILGWARTGKIPAFKVGRQWRFLRKAIYDFVNTPSNMPPQQPKVSPQSSKGGGPKGVQLTPDTFNIDRYKCQKPRRIVPR